MFTFILAVICAIAYAYAGYKYGRAVEAKAQAITAAFKSSANAAHCPRQEASHELAHKIALALHPPTKYCTDNSVRLRTENVILEVLSGVVAGLSDRKETF